MKVLKTTVVGLGRIGWQYHIPEILKNGKFELTAVVDPMRERLDEAEKEFNVKGFENYDKMLTSKPDLVVIASPTPFHKEQIIKALEAGINVFADKPIAVNLQETDEIVSAMKRTNGKLMIYQPHRALREIIALKSILSTGLVGPVYMIKRAASNYTRRNDWQAFLKNGGGMLSNYGAHFVDQLLHLTDYKAQKISCVLRTVASMGDADDVVKAVIETEKGIILDLDINMASILPMQAWMILGERGSIVYDKESEKWKVKYYKKEELKDLQIQDGLAANGRQYGPGEEIIWHEEFFDPKDFEAIDFYDKCHEYFAEDKEPFVPVSETRELMRTLDECRKIATEDQDCSSGAL